MRQRLVAFVRSRPRVKRGLKAVLRVLGMEQRVARLVLGRREPRSFQGEDLPVTPRMLQILARLEAEIAAQEKRPKRG